MATQLTEFHYHLSQGGKVNQFDFEDKNFDIKNIYDFYTRKVTNWRLHIYQITLTWITERE